MTVSPHQPFSTIVIDLFPLHLYNMRMEIKIVNKDEFFNNAEFFKKNLGYVFNINKRLPKIYDLMFNGFSRVYNYKDNFLVIACDNKRIYSIASFEFEDGIWMIDSVSTREEFRGKGLATKVLKAGMKQKKVDFSLHVNKNNTVAFNLYKKLGFEIDSTHPKQLDGSFFMTKSQKTLEK